MSGQASIEPDLNNYEQWVHSHFKTGRIISSEEMHEALFSLLNYARSLEQRLKKLEEERDPGAV